MMVLLCIFIYLSWGCYSELGLLCQGSEGLLASSPVGPVMDLANLPELKPPCYSAVTKLFGDSSGGSMGVVKNEPGVSGAQGSGGGVGAGGGAPGSSTAVTHHHHMLHPATYHHGYHGYDPGALAALHHTAVSHS
jgi:hypothetical protein